MVKYYFEDKKRQALLKRALDEWLGTPYKHHTGVKQLGCDCIHFASCVYSEIGALYFKKEMVPDYPRDWHLHNTRELLKETIVKYLKGEFLNIDEKMMNGDLILSHYGKASSHAGIFFDGYVYQSLQDIGVRKITILDMKFKKRMKFIYRIIS